MVPLAIDIVTSELTGRESPVKALKEKNIPYYGVKEAVFPFNMFPEVDPVLGPEMRATGEVMGIAENFGLAFYKAEEAAGCKLPLSGTVLMTIRRHDRKYLLPIAQKIHELGFKIVATEGTARFLDENNIPNTEVKKLTEGRPNICDMIKNGDIQMIFNTPIGREGKTDDSYIRTMAIQNQIPYMTTIAAANATVIGIEAVLNKKGSELKSLQEYHQ